MMMLLGFGLAGASIRFRRARALRVRRSHHSLHGEGPAYGYAGYRSQVFFARRRSASIFGVTKDNA